MNLGVWSAKLIPSQKSEQDGERENIHIYTHTHKPQKRVKVTQSCLTLCDPMDYLDHEILQARILEWAAFPFSRGSSQPRDQTHVSCIVGGLFTS